MGRNTQHVRRFVLLPYATYYSVGSGRDESKPEIGRFRYCTFQLIPKYRIEKEGTLNANGQSGEWPLLPQP
jgi:hypothetical protein